MKFVYQLLTFTVAFLVIGILGLNTVTTGEQNWDEDSKAFIPVVSYEEALPVQLGQLDRDTELLWDDYHDSDGDDLYGNYSTLEGYMTSWGINATQLSVGPITTAILAGYDILVLIDEEIEYSPQEITDIQNWIAGGGKLLMIGENSGAFNMASNNLLLAPYNVQFVGISTSYADNFATHPITAGLTYISWAAGSALTVNPPANYLAWDASMNYTLATNESGVTVVIIDDSNMMRNDGIMNDDNLLCMQNTFEFLAVAYIPFALDIQLTPHDPPIQIPATGGSFMYDVLITNVDSVGGVFDGWIEALLPGAIPYEILVRTGLYIDPGVAISRPDLVQNVPGAAPAGTYVYQGHVGEYPDDPWDTDSFTFEKLATDGPSGYSGDWNLYGWEGVESTSWQPAVIPSKTELLGAFPNPFNPTTTLGFTLPEALEVNFVVYDISGRKVMTLIDGWRDAGNHKLTFDGSALASGLYFYKFKAGQHEACGKMVLMK